MMTRPANVTALEIVQELFAPNKRRLQAALGLILERVAGPSYKRVGFYYLGSTFTFDSDVVPRGTTMLEIPKELYPQMQEYYADCKRCEQEETRTLQLLSALLVATHGEQDMRDALPDVLLPDWLKCYSRTRPEGYPFEHNPRLKRLWEQNLNTIYHYAATKLIY